MGLIVGVFLFLIIMGAFINLVEKGAKGASSKVLRPYIGLLLISALIAGMGLVLSLIFHGIEDYFFSVAKGVAVFTGVVLCLQLICVIAKSFFLTD
jgi:hypothetical protein